MKLSLDNASDLAARALTAAGVSATNANVVAKALVAAERDGLASHGLSRVAYYADQAAAGKVDGLAEPTIAERAAVVMVDAHHGFAFPAVAAGLSRARALASQYGIAAVGVTNSHHFGVAGHPVEALAEDGLIGIAMGNAPASIAPWGGKRPLYGTDPIAFAAPRRDHSPLVVDLSVSRVARGKVMLAARTGESIPDDWALDAEGRPTTDPQAALAGSMLPMGDAKGAALALMVEILSAGLTGANFGYQASSLFDAEGPPTDIGQFFLVIDPEHFAGRDSFLDRIEGLFARMLEEPEVRLPGSRRLAAREAAHSAGIEIGEAIYRDLVARADG